MSLELSLATPICERLGIKYPIFQAGMGFVAHAELAAAVSNAGGLGCLGSGSMSSQELKEQILRCRDLTDHPFGIDILFGEIKADMAASTVVRFGNRREGFSSRAP